jgi:hypothetical protein
LKHRSRINEEQNLRIYERSPLVRATVNAIHIAFLLMSEESKKLLAYSLVFNKQDEIVSRAIKTPSVDLVLSDYILMKDGGALEES